jgi:hypothetical protein
LNYCNNDLCLFDFRDVPERITVRNEKTIVSLRCNVEQGNGKTFQVLLQEVNFLPDLWVNLFITNKTLKNGFKLGNEEIITHVSKRSNTLSFDRLLVKRMDLCQEGI